MVLKHRTFTQEFKKELIEQALYRSVPVSQLSRQHNIARPVIYRWIREYQKGRLSKTSSERTSTKAQIQDLETLVGRLMIDNELLKKALKAVQEQPKPNVIISGATEIPLDQ
jgi:transposase-like protein